MKKRNKLSAIFAVLLLIISIFTVAQIPVPVSAPPSPGSVEVSLPSYNYTYPTKKPGDGVVMELRIKNLTYPPDPVTSWEVNFAFDPTILQYVNFTEGGFLSQSGSVSIDYGTIDNVAGTVTGINVTLLGGLNSTGSGILAYLIFTVACLGSTTIDITYCKVLKPDWSEITLVPDPAVDGYFELGVEVSLPTYSYTYPVKKPGDGVVMELRIEAPTLAEWSVGIYTWEVNFAFDPTILQYVNFTEGGYLSQSGSVSINYGTINNTAGTVTGINVTLLGGLNSTGSGILGNLVFWVVGMGSTTIDLTYVKVFDRQDHDLPVTIVDGNLALGTVFELPSLSLVYPDYTIGYTFEMNLTVDTPELHGWQAGFQWDPAVLNCTGISWGLGFFLNQSGPIEWYAGEINNETGVATPFGTTLVGNYSASGFDGVLATIGFQVVGAGSTDITLVNYTAMEPAGNNIPLTTVDGYFGLGATMELGSSVIWRYPTKNIGDEFSMNLTIKSPELHAWQAGLSFDSNVVNVINITGGIGFFLNGSGPIEWYYDPSYINNTAGTVDTFGCTLLGNVSAPATGPGGAVVATIWFNATGAGNTTIEITDARAFSSEIPVTTVDGYFELGGEMSIVPSTTWKIPVGSTFTVDLTIKSPELHAWQAGLSFDSNVVNVINITGGIGFFLNGSGPIEWYYDPSYINNTAGTVDTFGCTLLGNVSAPATGPGGAVVATITFLVVGYVTTYPWSTTIEITDAQAYSSIIPLTIVDGQFKLKIGDVNADGTVNVLDIILVLINVGPVPPKPPACDLNGDGTVNVLDIILALINVGAYDP